jgi:signal transduction histidine kinase
MLDILLASARSQLQLVNGLLDIARIESGTMTLDQAPFEPAALTEDTLRLIAPEIESKRLALSVSIAPAARREVIGDALAFRQIVTNLIGNALKFTDEGSIGVELAIGEAGALVLAVSDTGVGIDPAEHDRIFERFVQVDGASTRRVGGAGLGLAITRALVELKRGTIRVDSALGAGATFTVVLPLRPAEALASAA